MINTCFCYYVFSVVYTDVTVKGRVGLLIQGDSFVPENYDVDYTWNSEVSVGLVSLAHTFIKVATFKNHIWHCFR